MILICLDVSRDDERLHPSRSVRLSNYKVSCGPENKIIMELLVVKFKNLTVKLRAFGASLVLVLPLTSACLCFCFTEARNYFLELVEGLLKAYS